MVKELEEEEQLLWVEVALVETMMGMALYLPVDDQTVDTLKWSCLPSFIG
ncbi:hypothetical protein VULLAG_LOCUS10131 [Vulpes lagopus]